MDSEDQRFCDFLTWASQNGTPDVMAHFGLHGRSRFFSDASRLTEYYKTSGDILFAKPPAVAGAAPYTFLPGPQQAIGHIGNFINLHKAVSATADTALLPVGGLVPKRSKTWVSSNLFEKLNDLLTNEDSDIRRLSTSSIERAFVYLDVSDFSKYHAGEQCLIINSLVRTVQALSESGVPGIREAVGDHEAELCIGDGYIYAFRSANSAAFFATSLAYLIELLVAQKALPVAYHFRMSVHTGPVFSFWDPGRGGWNYIGDGINGGQRVLGAIGKDIDDVLFVSASIKQSLTAENDVASVRSLLLHSLHNRGRRLDKHGNAWRVYELNHTSAVSKVFDSIVKTLAS